MWAYIHLIYKLDRAIAQAVRQRRLITEVRGSPCGICGTQSGSGTGFSLFFVFPCQYNSTGAPYSYTCITWEINNRPICGHISDIVPQHRCEQQH
jgi:hypothetical protein